MTSQITKIKIAFPPNYEFIKQHFPHCEEYEAIFCYGDVIYNPYDVPITSDLYAHESVHALQQVAAPSVDDWYYLYATDPSFRLEQEVDAYRAQYLHLSREVKDRNVLNRYLNALSSALSSPLYGSLITHSEARALIKSS